jgi:hypothetical protein
VSAQLTNAFFPASTNDASKLVSGRADQQSELGNKGTAAAGFAQLLDELQGQQLGKTNRGQETEKAPFSQEHEHADLTPFSTATAPLVATIPGKQVATRDESTSSKASQTEAVKSASKSIAEPAVKSPTPTSRETPPVQILTSQKLDTTATQSRTSQKSDATPEKTHTSQKPDTSTETHYTTKQGETSPVPLHTTDELDPAMEKFETTKPNDSAPAQFRTTKQDGNTQEPVRPSRRREADRFITQLETTTTPPTNHRESAESMNVSRLPYAETETQSSVKITRQDTVAQAPPVLLHPKFITAAPSRTGSVVASESTPVVAPSGQQAHGESLNTFPPTQHASLSTSVVTNATTVVKAQTFEHRPVLSEPETAHSQLAGYSRESTNVVHDSAKAGGQPSVAFSAPMKVARYQTATSKILIANQTLENTIPSALANTFSTTIVSAKEPTFVAPTSQPRFAPSAPVSFIPAGQVATSPAVPASGTAVKQSITRLMPVANASALVTADKESSLSVKPAAVKADSIAQPNLAKVETSSSLPSAPLSATTKNRVDPRRAEIEYSQASESSQRASTEIVAPASAQPSVQHASSSKQPLAKFERNETDSPSILSTMPSQVTSPVQQKQVPQTPTAKVILESTTAKVSQDPKVITAKVSQAPATVEAPAADVPLPVSPVVSPNQPKQEVVVEPTIAKTTIVPAANDKVPSPTSKVKLAPQVPNSGQEVPQAEPGPQTVPEEIRPRLPSHQAPRLATNSASAPATNSQLVADPKSATPSGPMADKSSPEAAEPKPTTKRKETAAREKGERPSTSSATTTLEQLSTPNPQATTATTEPPKVDPSRPVELSPVMTPVTTAETPSHSISSHPVANAAQTPLSDAPAPVLLPTTNPVFSIPTVVAPAAVGEPRVTEPWTPSKLSANDVGLYDRAAADPGLSMTVLPHSAHLSIASSGGDLALHVRVRDGNADINVSGAMAPMFEAKAPEVRAVLAGEGLNLGSFATDQQGSQQGQQGQPEATTNPRDSHPHPAHRRTTLTGPEVQVADDTRIHVTA